jgi:uncharacterized damage-inducible protein DinB
MHSNLRLTCLAVLVLGPGLAAPTFAIEEKPSTFQTSILRSVDDVSSKLSRLADAIPEDNFGWQPAAGVRSVREVVLHVASANYFFGSILGAKIPEGINPRELEKSVQGKAQTLEVLKQSIEFARAAIAAMPESDLPNEVDFFGQKVPNMRVVMIISDHAHEHLGQLIAYARSNGIAPPWSP